MASIFAPIFNFAIALSLSCDISNAHIQQSALPLAQMTGASFGLHLDRNGAQRLQYTMPFARIPTSGSCTVTYCTSCLLRQHSSPLSAICKQPSNTLPPHHLYATSTPPPHHLHPSRTTAQLDSVVPLSTSRRGWLAARRQAGATRGHEAQLTMPFRRSRKAQAPDASTGSVWWPC